MKEVGKIYSAVDGDKLEVGDIVVLTNERDGAQTVTYCNPEGMWFAIDAKEFWQKFEKKEWENERVQ